MGDKSKEIGDKNRDITNWLGKYQFRENENIRNFELVFQMLINILTSSKPPYPVP